MPSISSLINYLLNSRIIAPLKRLNLCKKGDTKSQSNINNLTNITKIAEVNVLSLITAEINVAKRQFTERKIIMQNLKRLPLIQTESELSASVFINSFTLAFHNILRNACMYTHEDSPIIVIGERKGLKTFISVLDYGQGIPEAEIEKVLNFPSQKNHILCNETNTDADISASINKNELALICAKKAMEKVGGSMTLKNHKNVGLLVTLGL